MRGLMSKVMPFAWASTTATLGSVKSSSKRCLGWHLALPIYARRARLSLLPGSRCADAMCCSPSSPPSTTSWCRCRKVCGASRSRRRHPGRPPAGRSASAATRTPLKRAGLACPTIQTISTTSLSSMATWRCTSSRARLSPGGWLSGCRHTRGTSLGTRRGCLVRLVWGAAGCRLGCGGSAGVADLGAWLGAVSTELGVPVEEVLPQSVQDGMLELTGEIAHNVVRVAVPLTSYLMGVAVGRGASPEEALRIVGGLVPEHDE